MKRALLACAFTLLQGACLLAAQQPATATATPTPAAATPTPAAAGHRVAQARTQPEFNDYQTAKAVTGGAAMEKAANDFAEKYPSSELRPYLYYKAMGEYQKDNNLDKMLAMGEKVLTLDPDNAVALVLTATVLSDHLTDAQQDRAQKIAEIRKNALRALETVDVSVVPPEGATAEQVTAYKNMLRSMAHSSLGITSMKTGDDPGAEKEFRIAADLSQSQPDPFVWYHMALAQDHQGKYPEALVSVDQALKYIGSNPDLGKLASGERERLLQLTAAPSGAVSPQPNPSPSPH